MQMWVSTTSVANHTSLNRHSEPHGGNRRHWFFVNLLIKLCLRTHVSIRFMCVTAQCFAKCLLLEKYNFKQNAVIFDSKTL